MTRLIVVRHPPVNDGDLCYGQSNPSFSLAPEALDILVDRLRHLLSCSPAQASETTRLAHLQPPTGDAKRRVQLWTSPAERCLAVAHPVAEALQPDVTAPHSEPRLWEISMGAWEGLKYSHLQTRADFSHWMENWQTHAPPQGETITQLTERVAHWLSELDLTMDHLVIAHAGVARALMVLLDAKSWPDALSTKIRHLVPLQWTLSGSDTSPTTS